MKNDEKVTDIWSLLETGKNFNRLHSLVDEGKENYDNYHGRQWEGLKKPSSGSEPITLNIIKPIVKYKVNVVNQNNYQIVFNPNTYNTPEELESLRSTTKGLNQFINRMWEKSQSGKKVRNIVKNACINSEGIIYFYNEDDMIQSEEIDKNNIYYGNENNENIQEQPYILVTKRMPVVKAKELAKKMKEDGNCDATDEEIDGIVSDMDYQEEQGKDYMLMEVSPACTIVYKFERNEEGIVETSIATKTCNIMKPQSTECELYPFAHFIWEQEKGYARGVSEVRGLLDNQREINKTATRRAIAVKIGAYPKLVADMQYVSNPSALNEVGSTVKLENMRANDVNNVISYLQPATMSSDAYNLQKDLISETRELAGAGEVATGTVNTTSSTSGRAILAVQQASQQPLNEQVESYKYFLEDCARIIFEIIKANYIDGLTLYTSEDDIDELGQTQVINTPFKITQDQLKALDLNLKIDITPTSAFDKYAMESSLENLLTNQLITLEEYADALPEDSAMPKQALDDILLKRREKRNKINQMQQQVNAIDSAIKQELMAQGGGAGVMPEMQASGNGGNGQAITGGQQVQSQAQV